MKDKKKILNSWIVTTFLMDQKIIHAHECIIYIDEGMLIFKKDGRIVFAFQKDSWRWLQEGEFLE